MFVLDPTYHQTDAKQMLTGYDFRELNLKNEEDNKQVKTKAASDLGVNPKKAEEEETPPRRRRPHTDESSTVEDWASVVMEAVK